MILLEKMHGVTTLPLKPRENRVLYTENKKIIRIT
nr:MAG TPA: hypothetical protein [Caudoviricetes sp.]